MSNFFKQLSLLEAKKPEYSISISAPISTYFFASGDFSNFLELEKILSKGEKMTGGGSGMGEADLSISTKSWEMTLVKLKRQIIKKKLKNASYIVWEIIKDDMEIIKKGKF